MEFDEIYDSKIEFYIAEFCEKQRIADMREMPQAVWNSCLMYVRRYVFPDKSELKSNEILGDAPMNCNAYDYNKLLSIADCYIYLCGMYDKEISAMGFSKLTGIDADTIYQWGNNVNRVSSSALIIYKKLMSSREESLSNKLADGRKNPVGILAILNRHYQWNLPGVSKEPAKKALSIEELPQLNSPKDIIDG